MPHIVLEYSSNLPEAPDYLELFARIHSTLHQVGGIRLDNCKSRAREAADYLIGDGDESNAFVHLQISFMEGRRYEIKQAIGEQCLEILKQVYSASIKSFDLQITVEVDDIARDFYFKHPEGSLTPQ